MPNFRMTNQWRNPNDEDKPAFDIRPSDLICHSGFVISGSPSLVSQTLNLM